MLKSEKKKTLKIRAHPGNRPQASGFVGRHANHYGTRPGRARLKITIHIDETIRVSANIVFLTHVKT